MLFLQLCLCSLSYILKFKKKSFLTTIWIGCLFFFVDNEDIDSGNTASWCGSTSAWSSVWAGHCCTFESSFGSNTSVLSLAGQLLPFFSCWSIDPFLRLGFRVTWVSVLRVYLSSLLNTDSKLLKKLLMLTVCFYKIRTGLLEFCMPK